MTEIRICNGTSSIKVQCSPLSKLLYDSDEDVYVCEYENSMYGLFAIALVIMVVIPMALIIYCTVKCHNNVQKKRLNTNYSLESSFSSQYPASDGDLQTLPYDDTECLIGQQHRPLKRHKHKLYYPYPAYGTCNQSLSQEGSTSEYQVQKSTPTKPEDVPILAGAGTHHFVSNSAPVIDSKLQKVRNHLNNKNDVMEGNIPRRSLNSLANVERQTSRSLLEGYQGRNDSNSCLLIKPKPKSFTGSTTTSRSSDIESLTHRKRKPSKKKPESKKLAQEPPSDEAKGSNTDINKAPSLKSIEIEREESFSSVQKNRIVSATPTRNMTTRQDFDDYLVESVLKLPEDQRNGMFLIRNSNSSEGCKILTMYCKLGDTNATLYYFKIRQTEESLFYFENTKETFESLDTLINENKEKQSILPCLLGDCLGKNF